MFVAVATKSSRHAVGEQMGSMILFVNRTYSETGQVKLASADWRVRPEVEFNYYPIGATSSGSCGWMAAFGVGDDP